MGENVPEVNLLYSEIVVFWYAMPCTFVDGVPAF
jgi:hypothetical protein